MSLSVLQIEDVRPLFARPIPMPASRADLSDLRGLLYYLENPNRHCDPVLRRQQIDALKRALDIMETGDPASPLWWAAGALRKSVRKVSPRMYVTVDRELETWALDQIFELMPGDDTDARH